MISGINDELVLAARLLLATLFLIFSLRKVRDYSGTVDQMVQPGHPAPVLATSYRSSWKFRSRLRSLLAHSHVPWLHSWLYIHLELRLSDIAIGP